MREFFHFAASASHESLVFYTLCIHHNVSIISVPRYMVCAQGNMKALFISLSFAVSLSLLSGAIKAVWLLQLKERHGNNCKKKMSLYTTTLKRNTNRLGVEY